MQSIVILGIIASVYNIVFMYVPVNKQDITVSIHWASVRSVQAHEGLHEGGKLAPVRHPAVHDPARGEALQ